jgi:hypothetical protein
MKTIVGCGWKGTDSKAEVLADKTIPVGTVAPDSAALLFPLLVTANAQLDSLPAASYIAGRRGLTFDDGS